MPGTPGTFSDDLAQLAESVKPNHPDKRVRRPWPSTWMVAFTAVPGFAWTDEPSVTVEPEWRASLGYTFSIVGLQNPMGLDQGIGSLNAGPPVHADPPQAPTPTPEAFAVPVSHKSIPALRARLDYTAALDHQIPTDLNLPAPVVVAPRLRIHLPKPQILPLRPRYGFAPKPEDPAAAKETPKVEAKSQPKEPPKENAAQLAARRAQELKERESARVKQIPAQPPKAKETPKSEAKPEAKPEVKPEVRKEEARKPEPAPKPEAKKAEGKKEEPRKPEQKSEAKKEEPRKPEVKSEPAKVEVPVETVAPTFGVKEAEVTGGGKAKWAIAAVLVLCAGGGFMYSRSGKPKDVVLPRSAPAAGQITMGADSWITDWAGDSTGSARGRQITLYKPARGKRDYILEFSASPEQNAIGWAFRVKDNRNYYCMKLEWNGEGTQKKAQIVKFAVVNGEEQAHRVVELNQPVDSTKPARVIVDVRGAQFSTQVNGQHVDHWMDNQLAEGTVGFTNERSERAVVRTVKVSY